MELTQQQWLSKLYAATDVKKVGVVDNETRRGVYLRLTTGLSTGVWFFGVDEGGHTLVEWVNE